MRSIVMASLLLLAAPMTPSRYEIDDAEVFDPKTNLTWQRCSVGQRWSGELGCVGVIRQMSWQDAIKRADARWQLPTKEELASLVESERGTPTIDERAFPDMELTKLWYWTSTRDGALAWYVAFGGGSVRTGSPSELSSVRLVRHGR